MQGRVINRTIEPAVLAARAAKNDVQRTIVQAAFGFVLRIRHIGTAPI
jgi:hypothetical protein